MHPSRNSFLRWISLALVLAALGMGVMGWMRRFDLGAMVGEASEFQPGFGGTDWVVWENTATGVHALKIHPIIKNNPNYGSSYIHEGDHLFRIDQHDVYDAEVAHAIASHASPGTVLMYQVRRWDALESGGTWKNILIPVSFLPRFTFREYTGIWTIYPWLLVVGVFLSLVTFLILFPILRPTLREHWPGLLLAGMCLGLFLLLGLRHLNLIVRTEYVKIQFEQWFTVAVLWLLPLYGSLALFSPLRGRWRLTVIAPLACTFLLGMSGTQLVFGGDLGTLGQLLEQCVYFLFMLQVAWMLAWSMLASWKGRSLIDKTFHLLAFSYASSLVFLFLLGILGLEDNWSGEPAAFLASGGIFIPLISISASQLKFGRVSLVLTTSLQYVILAAASLFFFYVIEKVLSSVGIQFRYQIYLELSLLLVVVFLLRAVWNSYEGRWRNYFILAQQERREKISAFSARIPQYTSSRKLLEDLVEAMQAYFETSFIAIRLHEEDPVGSQLNLDPAIQEALHNALAAKSLYWVRNRQVSMEHLPAELESALIASPASVALPISVNENIYGMLYLGGKRRGVYNLDDLEILSRIIQQTRLTLGVLHLLEREKLLMEKNYEANLTALRSQINPHFLFNTLNTISALIHDDPDGAEKAVEKLAFIFRYTLKHSDKAAVTMRDELSLVRTYLEIEQIRFGDRLNLEMDLDPEGMDVELPAFVVQTIVENCIKHGTGRITGKGKVSILLRKEADMVRCEIVDNGPGIDLSRVRASTGLSNILTRMSHIYGRDDLLKFENTGNGTRVTVWLPVKKA